MADAETETPDAADQEAEQNTATAESTDDATNQAGDNATEDSIPEFEQLQPNPPQAVQNGDFSRFSGVTVTVTAELGRTQLKIQELIGLAEGSVIELHRAISAPVELVAQGVPMGNGEVVVIDNQFAIRIKEIYAS